MGYKTLRECVDDLAATGQLIALDEEVDARLEAAEIHRRVNQAGGPAILFNRVKATPNSEASSLGWGCRFPMVSNLFGTIDRARFVFRDALEPVRRLIELKVDPTAFWRKPTRYIGVPRSLWMMRPKRVSPGPVFENSTSINQLPQQISWPNDGGAFITLPLVYTEHPDRPGFKDSNLGMYRVQISGGKYTPNDEVGLHYQIHRGIGVHHAAAIRKGKPIRVNIFVGGAPAMIFAAVMPLPEGMSELMFAGALGRRRIRMATIGIATDQSSCDETDETCLCFPPLTEFAAYAEADFCITGTINPDKKLPEGPFGDHLGYYSLQHDFPVLRVERVFHRSGAIWPFTVVGRPPQEDTIFGQLIHELTGPLIPTVIAGVKAVHAVDAAGVHPLLLAIGSERYTPYTTPARPQELLTQANAILGQGQMSLAKYLLIVNEADNPQLDIHDAATFLRHLLERVDWRRDLHFQTCTTIDTLDYSGSGLNEGSKVVIAAVGPAQRSLPTEIPAESRLPDGFGEPRIAVPGVLVVKGPRYSTDSSGRDAGVDRFCTAFTAQDKINSFPLIVIVDDSEFTAKNLANFLWVTFTRSNPAADIGGIDSFVDQKHWGCRGSLVIDARIKPHHAPPLEPDPEVARRVDRFFISGGPLAKWG